MRNDHGGAGGKHNGTFCDEKKKRRIRTLPKEVENLQSPDQRFKRRIMIEEDFFPNNFDLKSVFEQFD